MAKIQVLTCDACGTHDDAAGVGRVTVTTPDGVLSLDLCESDRSTLLGPLGEVPRAQWKTRTAGVRRPLAKVRIEDLPPATPPARKAGTGAKVRTRRPRP